MTASFEVFLVKLPVELALRVAVVWVLLPVALAFLVELAESFFWAMAVLLTEAEWLPEALWVEFAF